MRADNQPHAESKRQRPVACEKEKKGKLYKIYL